MGATTARIRRQASVRDPALAQRPARTRYTTLSVDVHTAHLFRAWVAAQTGDAHGPIAIHLRKAILRYMQATDPKAAEALARLRSGSNGGEPSWGDYDGGP